MEVTIARHCVPQDADGLSPLQRALLDHPSRVRIASAPTGAGKSYAFQVAMRLHGQRILFIVPTRRLTQNLAAGLVKDLIQDASWSEARAHGSVAIWSSEQTAALKAAGELSVSGVRVRQMQALQLGSDDGEMIFAVPEVVSALLVRRRLEAGQAGAGVFDLLGDFDHIVFDEFHSIEARGFGLAALLALLATASLERRSGFGRARISFLSATPLDLRPTLLEIGVPEDRMVVLQEELAPDGRALHGDVRLSLVEAPSLYELILDHLPRIGTELAAGRQVVVIYNALVALEKDLPALARVLPESGIAPERVLVINSVRDSIAECLHRGGFAFGRQRDPLAYDLILASASVEMGVTFRNADLMLMEPGFEAMNFLQRYGRAARRGADGQVIVRLDADEVRRKPWLRELADWVGKHDGEQAGIDALTEVLSRSVLAQLGVAPGAEPTAGTFGRLSNRAIWCSGLYWSVLLAHPSNRGHRGRHLLENQPASARALYRLEQDVRGLAREHGLAEPVEQWIKLFRAQAFDLRGIEPKVRVVSDSGESFDYPQVWLQRETTVFERGTQVGDEVHIRGSVDDYWRDQQDASAKRAWVCHFPHTSEVATLAHDAGLVEQWCRRMEIIDPYGVDWDAYPEALTAAKKLIRLTGLVPGHDPDIPMEAIHGIL
jgi:CRISPR-associated endonuclease/helicase Cas3